MNRDYGFQVFQSKGDVRLVASRLVENGIGAGVLLLNHARLRNIEMLYDDVLVVGRSGLVACEDVPRRQLGRVNERAWYEENAIVKYLLKGSISMPWVTGQIGIFQSNFEITTHKGPPEHAFTGTIVNIK